MKILIADKFEAVGIDGLKKLGAEVACEPGLKDEALAKRVAEYDPAILIVRSTKVSAATLQAGKKKGPGVRLAAVCTDCHGVHDIQRSNDPKSTVMSANLQRTCQKCHEGANASFPKAWMSHYEPTPQKAPLVWGVMLFYKLMIPFMVGGLVLQIALHLWRVVVNR